MLAAFPPVTAKNKDETPANVSSVTHARRVRRRSPPFEIGDKIAWVYNHFGADDADLDPCLSSGAQSLRNWARGNPVRFYNLLWPKAEAARILQFKPIDDSVLVEAVFRFDEKRIAVIADMAAALEKTMHDIAHRAMWILMVDPPELAERLTRSFGTMLQRLCVEHMCTALASPSKCLALYRGTLWPYCLRTVTDWPSLTM